MNSCCSPRRLPWAILLGTVVLGLSLSAALGAQAGALDSVGINSGANAPAGLRLTSGVGSGAPEWLPFFNAALGLLNLLLIFWLYRNSGASPSIPDGQDVVTESSSGRTQRRLDKRKREIDELRTQVESLNGFGKPGAAPVTAEQVQELVRAQVREELARLAAANTIAPPTSRPAAA